MNADESLRPTARQRLFAQIEIKSHPRLVPNDTQNIANKYVFKSEFPSKSYFHYFVASKSTFVSLIGLKVQIRVQ